MESPNYARSYGLKRSSRSTSRRRRRWEWILGQSSLLTRDHQPTALVTFAEAAGIHALEKAVPSVG